VRALPDHERRNVLLTLDLLVSFENRLARNMFTPREVEVFSWVARGKTDLEIALILGASPRTIEKHVQSILAKLGVENRTAAAIVGIEAASVLF
jgi:DNA-binding NarL/FixJ family response regulator